MLGLRLGFSDESNFAEDTTTKQAYDLLVDGFGAGLQRPLLLVAELPDGTDLAALDAITDAVAADPGVAFVSDRRAQRPRQPDRGACGTSCPTTGPQDEATTDLVNRLRDDVLPPVEAGRRRRRRRHRHRRRQRRLLRLPRRRGCRTSSPPCWRCRSCC